MPILHLTDEQALALLQQLPDDQKKRLLDTISQSSPTGKRPKFGSAKEDILYIADDFDAPLEDFKEYM